MTTRTDHRIDPGPRVRLYRVATERGETWLWSISADDAAYCAYSHDLLPGMPLYDDIDVREATATRDDLDAAAATADEHVRCGFASPATRRRLRAFAPQAA